MLNLNRIREFIDEINKKCEDLIKQKNKVEASFKKEKTATKAEGKMLIKDMRLSFDKYCDEHFTPLSEKLYDIIQLLSEDYKKEINRIKIDKTEFDKSSIDECNASLIKIIEELNTNITSLNAIDFEAIFPPIKVKIGNDTISTYTDNDGELSTFTYNEDTGEFSQGSANSKANNKQLTSLVEQIAVLCKRGMLCVKKMELLYTEHIDIKGYEKFVLDSVEDWNTKRKKQIDDEFAIQCYNAFNSNEAEEKYRAFFDELYNSTKHNKVDYKTGTLTDSEEITIGTMKISVAENEVNNVIASTNEYLKTHLVNGELPVPVILNLKNCGNILLNLYETEEYNYMVNQFVENVILKFLLAFPANKIKFRLIDTCSKMNFYPFNQLTKINPDILMDGIIRDNRKLENVIKDMKELMHNIGDKKLSVNNVSNIFEYNKAFETNPQTYHLLVLTDFPNGIQEDLAQDILEIVKSGNKAGIFTLLINNTAVEQSNYRNKSVYEKIISNISKHAICISAGLFDLSVDTDIDNTFEVDNDINIDLLPEIVEVMKNNAEQTKQKNVLIETMFDETDNAIQSAKGIPSAAEVLDIPIGVRGGEIQTLKLETNGGASPHAVIIGGTGSGKSNLLHTIILNTCYKYSPEDVNLYLIDFKGGNEFKFYESNKVIEKQIPHIKLTGLTSDVEDGIAILSNLQNVLIERQEIFRKANVSDIVQYCQTGNKMPRLFVIVDEIQELFEQDDKLAEKAISILRELFKLGRAYGITILWASQNIPSAHGLRDKVLSQIGNRISLKLNDPDDAIAIQIDPKMVRALNRPEKGLGIIKDSRTGNNSVEFRVAYAENVANRQKYAQAIVEKWQDITKQMGYEPLFIVGDDEVPSPTARNSIFSLTPTKKSIISKAFDEYTVQFGQNYITGKPFNIDVNLRTNKSNIAFMGTDVETIRDMMGYSLMSVVINHITNADCIENPTKIYYANGEGVIPKNATDLFNTVKQDFSHIVENVSSVNSLKETITNLYKNYKSRKEESEKLDEAKPYSPYFLVIHSLQSYIDLFESNPILQLNDQKSDSQDNSSNTSVGNAANLIDMLQMANSKSGSLYDTNSDSIAFVNAFKELMDRAGQYGIHFIISLDNPDAIRSIRDELYNMTYKVFTKDINPTVISQIVGMYSNSTNTNPEITLVVIHNEKYKVRVYRYNDDTDSKWYKNLSKKYLELR